MKTIWRANISLDLDDIKNNPVPNILNTLKNFNFNESALSELNIIITELYNNSVDHGLLDLDSSLKQEEKGLEKYYNLRKERLNELSTGIIQFDFCLDKNTLTIEASDSGKGFDYTTFISKPLVYEKHSGKGLYIINQIASSVLYNFEKNILTVEYKIPSYSATQVSKPAQVTKFKAGASDSLK